MLLFDSTHTQLQAVALLQLQSASQSNGRQGVPCGVLHQGTNQFHLVEGAVILDNKHALDIHADLDFN